MSGVNIEEVNNKTVIFKFANGSLNVTIKCGDLSKEVCDAIVNPTNVKMAQNGGLDAIIHQTMGAFFTNQIDSLSQELGELACPVGNSRIFIAKSTRDPNIARFVINTVGPEYRKEGKERATFLLQSCYCTSLSIANTYGLSSIAYPAIACGAHHFPPNEAAQVAIDTIRQNSYQVKDVRFVLFDKEIYNVFIREWTDYSEKINREANVIDDRDRDRDRDRFRPTSVVPLPSPTSSKRYCVLCKKQEEKKQAAFDHQYLCDQCSTLTRSETFDRLLQEFRLAADKSFEDLKKECQALKPIFDLHPLVYTPSQKFDQSIHRRDTVAESYLQNHCDKTFRNTMPMDILGDGNCFYNTFVKLAGVGTTTEAATVTPVELRARNVLELILHREQYQAKYESLAVILDEFQKYVTSEMVHDRNYASVWDFLSIPTVLNIKVISVYPKVNGSEDINYLKLNDKTFEPLDDGTANSNSTTTTLAEVKLLFSHCNKPIHLKPHSPEWIPNHFVPLLNLR